ncbi:MAG: zinc ribbon domain-containing protein [Acidimicrobiales bacterium]
MSDGTTFTCPHCGAVNPDDPSFVTWCATCDYNVDPDGTTARIASQQAGAAKPLSFAARFALGLLVHGTVAARVATFGAYLIWATWFSIVGTMVGGGLLLLGALLLPHGGRIPDNAVLLDTENDAAFYAYVAAIAEDHGVDTFLIASVSTTSSGTGLGRSAPSFSDEVLVLRVTRFGSVSTGPNLRPSSRLSSKVARPADAPLAAGLRAATQSLATIVSGSQWHRPRDTGRLLGSATNPETTKRFEGETDGPSLATVANVLRPERPCLVWPVTCSSGRSEVRQSTLQEAVVETYHRRVADRRGGEVVRRLLDLELMTSSMVNAAVRARRRRVAARHYCPLRRPGIPITSGSGSGANLWWGSMIDGEWPTVPARAAVVGTAHPSVSPPLVPAIAHATLRGTIEVRLFDNLTAM